MNIKNEALEKTGRFYLEQETETIAELNYELPDEKIMLITHTEVDESLKGKGVGQELVLKAVEFARENAFTISSTCRFASAILIRNKEFHDVYDTEKNNC